MADPAPAAAAAPAPGPAQAMVKAPRFVVAVDFGTTFSGFAYTPYKRMSIEDCGVVPQSDIKEVVEWPGAAANSPYIKTPTVQLYNGAESEQWGWTAQSSMAVGPAAFLSRLFKLHLSEDTDDLPPLPPFARGPDGVILVIADYLRHLTAFILTTINAQAKAQADKVPVTVEDIKWCLTVPAMWSAHAKNKMERAAQKAGMIQGPHGKPGVGSKHELQIVLEPEAAALDCLSTLLKTERATPDQRIVDENAAYMVVDLGGGTADLIVIGFDGKDGELKMTELVPGSGALAGGSYVDEAFWDFFTSEVFPDWPRVQQQHPDHAEKMRKSFDQLKRDFTGNEKDNFFGIPAAVVKLLDPAKFPNARTDSGLHLSLEQMKQFFDIPLRQTCSLIRTHLETVQAKFPHRNVIMLFVGGFSESKYVSSVIKARFEKQMKIFQPPVPGGAIARGAVTLGLNPYVFTKRIARLCYGTLAYRPWSQSDPVEEKLLQPDGSALVHVFAVIVRAGEAINQGTVFTRQFVARNPEERFANVDLFSFDGFEPPVFKSGDGLKPLCKLVCPIPDDLTDPKIIVEIKLGGPKLEASTYPRERPEAKQSAEIEFPNSSDC